MKHKILMTLALLITAVTGAWAQNVGIAEMTSDLKNTWTNDEAVLTATDLPGFVKVESDVAKAFSGELPQTGFTMIIYAFSEEGKTRYVSYQNGVFVEDYAEEYTHGTLKGFSFPIYYISESGIEVTWDPTTRTGTFEMPAYDVEIAPIYAPAAKWATDGDKVLAPTAVEGIIAGTEDAIVKAGTVAQGQGTVMYFATTDAEMTAEKAAKADGWLATVPTAEGYDGAQTVYVWYYIKGADAPQGQTATAENTFNDSEICAEPIKVEVLSNKFDINFNAANANTIEAGKATVTVSGAAATVTEGKLEGVKMGSEVKIKAKEGYKFRKAEGKKHEPLIVTPVVGQIIGSDGKNYDANATLPDGVTALAKIAYVGSETGDDTYKNGLALALEDVSGSKTWCNQLSATCLGTQYDSDTKFNDLAGIANTDALVNHTDHTHAAATAARGYNGGTHPTGTSAWFLPSAGQWNKMIGAAGLNNLGLRERTRYWSSTECRAGNAWDFYSNDFDWLIDRKIVAGRVRACLAF